MTNFLLTCWLFTVQVCCELWSVVEVVYSITISVLVANSENLFDVVANPARGLLNREKGIKREFMAAHHAPPPLRCSYEAKQKTKNKRRAQHREQDQMTRIALRDAYACMRRCYARLGLSRTRTAFLRLAYKADWCYFASSTFSCTLMIKLF